MAGEVVGAGVDGDAAAEDAVLAVDLDVFVDAAVHGMAVGVGFEVAEVADVALAVHGAGVVVGVGVEVAAGGGTVCGGDVAEFVDVEAVFGVGLEPHHVGFDEWVGERLREGGVVDQRRQLSYVNP